MVGQVSPDYCMYSRFPCPQVGLGLIYFPLVALLVGLEDQEGPISVLRFKRSGFSPVVNVVCILPSKMYRLL